MVKLQASGKKLSAADEESYEYISFDLDRKISALKDEVLLSMLSLFIDEFRACTNLLT